MSFVPSLRKVFAVLTSALLAAALLAACGNGSSDTANNTADSDGSAVSTDAGDSSPSAENASGDSSARTSDGTWDGQTLTAGNFSTEVLKAQRRAGTYKLELNQSFSGVSSTTRAEGRITGDRAEVHSVTDMGEQKLETTATGGYLYLKAPALATEEPWLKLDPRAKAGMGKIIGQFGGGADATGLTEAFSRAVSVRTDGKVEDAGDLDTLKYAVSLPRSVLADQMGMPKEIISVLPKNIEYVVWVDEDNLIRKMEMDLEVMGQQSRTEMRFSDYGAAVTIEAPPADQTTTREPAMPRMPGMTQ